ncbi:MAG: ACT domain-containing protein [Sphingobium sp.]
MTDNSIIRETAAMIAGMTPLLRDGLFIFCGTDDPALAAGCHADALAMLVEPEGWSFILPLDKAAGLGFDCALPMRQITLSVLSALDGVGLTAAVATALARRGIACNMVAANRHDHVFVPAERAEEAMAALLALQAGR